MGEAMAMCVFLFTMCVVPLIRKVWSLYWRLKLGWKRTGGIAEWGVRGIREALRSETRDEERETGEVQMFGW